MTLNLCEDCGYHESWHPLEKGVNRLEGCKKFRPQSNESYTNRNKPQNHSPQLSGNKKGSCDPTFNHTIKEDTPEEGNVGVSRTSSGNHGQQARTNSKKFVSLDHPAGTFNLSKKIFDFYNVDAIEVEDVREFIRLLKEEISSIELSASETIDDIAPIIDKLTGRKLIE